MLSIVETRLENCAFPPAGWSSAALATDPRLGRVESFVRKNFSKPISLAVAADEACLARCYFSTYFRRRLGIGFHQWLTYLRVNKAAASLVAHDRSITEIAWSVGFRDMTTFARAFRRIAGTTPSEYRARQRAATWLRRKPTRPAESDARRTPVDGWIDPSSGSRRHSTLEKARRKHLKRIADGDGIA